MAGGAKTTGELEKLIFIHFSGPAAQGHDFLVFLSVCVRVGPWPIVFSHLPLSAIFPLIFLTSGYVYDSSCTVVPVGDNVS